jgi:hypothetical protein
MLTTRRPTGTSPTTKNPTSNPNSGQPVRAKPTTSQPSPRPKPCVNSTLASNGRISHDNFKKIVNKQDLFQICAAAAAAAGALMAENAGVGISSGVAAADKFIPKLDIGSMDAIVKKEISIGCR